MADAFLLNIIRRHYKERVKNHATCPTELREALKTNERVPAMIDNIAKDISKAEKSGVRFTVNDIQTMVYQATDILIELMVKKFNQTAYENAIAKARGELKQEKVDAVGLDEFGNGTVETEFGDVTIGDKDYGKTNQVQSGILPTTH